MDLTSMIGTAAKDMFATKVGEATGLDQKDVDKVVQAGLPVILGQLANNTADRQGAEALDAAVAKDHAGGSLLDSLGSLFSGGQAPAEGGKILEHILGSNQTKTNDTIAKKTGVDAATVAQILAFLAPLVMAYLGRKKSTDKLDAGGLSDMLGKQQGANGSPLSQIATALFDKNGDGSVIDDLLGGFLNRGK